MGKNVVLVGVVLIIGLVGYMVWTRSKTGGSVTPVKTVDEAIEQVGVKYPEFAGVRRSQPVIGASSGVRYKETAEGWNLLFWRGSGDCPAGCINHHEYYFEVSRTGMATRVGEYTRDFNPSINGFDEKGERLKNFVD